MKRTYAIAVAVLAIVCAVGWALSAATARDADRRALEAHDACVAHLRERNAARRENAWHRGELLADAARIANGRQP